MDFNKAAIIRLKKEGETFEVLADLESALKLKRNKATIDEALVYDFIYKDAKKGLKASEHEMQKIFKTENKKEIAEIIIRQGIIELTAEYKRKLTEEKRKKIINLIHRNAIDPRTNLPHPPQRIEAAMEEAKVKISETKSAEDQIQEVVLQLREILPIKFETRILEVTIPAHYTGKAYQIIKGFGSIKKEQWLDNGSLSARVEMPAGLSAEFFDEMNRLTHGNMESKIIEVK